MVFIDLLGCLPLIGQPLNSISMINLVMAVGLVVDYSMHVAHSFMAKSPQISRDERVVLAMKTIGVSVAKGLLSTFVGVLPLSLGSSEIFRVFFNMLVLVLAVGGTHGLLLMPVLLSVVGPSAAEVPGHAEAEELEHADAVG